MSWITQLEQSLDFIEENLTSTLRCEDIAKEAYSSQHHYSRMFTALCGVNVSEYIRKRRLTLAATDLVSKQEKVIDVAYMYQYNTPEAFTKAFKQFHGITPRQAKNHQGVLKTFSRPSFQSLIKGEYIMEYQVITKDNLEFHGVVKEFTTENGENFKQIPAFWQEVMTDGTFENMLPHADELGVVGLCYDWDNETNKFKYMIGVRNELPMDNVKQATFQNETFAAFKAEGPLPLSLQTTIKNVFEQWFPVSSYEHSGGPEIEIYPPGNPTQDDYVSYFWVPIKKK